MLKLVRLLLTATTRYPHVGDTELGQGSVSRPGTVLSQMREAHLLPGRPGTAADRHGDEPGRRAAAVRGSLPSLPPSPSPQHWVLAHPSSTAASSSWEGEAQAGRASRRPPPAPNTLRTPRSCRVRRCPSQGRTWGPRDDCRTFPCPTLGPCLPSR